MPDGSELLQHCVVVGKQNEENIAHQLYTDVWTLPYVVH